MMLNTKLKRTSLVVLAVVLMLSVFAMTAFADDLLVSPNPAADGDVVDTDAVDDASDVTDKSGDTADDTTAADDSSDEVKEDAAKEDDDDDSDEEKGFSTSDLVLLIIFIVVAVAVVIYCIVKREKVGKFFRGLKSEFKKIVWSPWNQVRKNTLVVIVLVLALAIIIGLLDFLFGQGITELKNIFNPTA